MLPLLLYLDKRIERLLRPAGRLELRATFIQRRCSRRSATNLSLKVVVPSEIYLPPGCLRRFPTYCYCPYTKAIWWLWYARSGPSTPDNFLGRKRSLAMKRYDTINRDNRQKASKYGEWTKDFNCTNEKLWTICIWSCIGHREDAWSSVLQLQLQRN